jgi:hypothetical protein
MVYFEIQPQPGEAEETRIRMTDFWVYFRTRGLRNTKECHPLDRETFHNAVRPVRYLAKWWIWKGGKCQWPWLIFKYDGASNGPVAGMWAVGLSHFCRNAGATITARVSLNDVAVTTRCESHTAGPPRLCYSVGYDHKLQLVQGCTHIWSIRMFQM